MAQGYVLSFARDVSLDNPAPDQVVIQTPDKRFPLASPLLPDSTAVSGSSPNAG